MQPRQAIKDAESCSDGALGVVLVGPRKAEIGEHAVAEVLRNVALEPPDLTGHGDLVGPQQLPHVFGIECSRQRGRAYKIAEQHGQLPPLNGQSTCLCAGGRVIGAEIGLLSLEALVVR
jgi:hypothetical protein